MLKYYDTDIPFDETTLIPPLNNNKYYINLDLPFSPSPVKM